MPELSTLISPTEVRAALDPTGLLLDAESLPDDSVRRQLYAGAAVTEVLSLDPDAASREGAAQQRIANAVNLLTAANIAPFITQITREQLDDASTSYQSVDWASRGSQLRGRARAEVAAAIDGAGSGAPAVPIFGFTIACGRRGSR